MAHDECGVGAQPLDLVRGIRDLLQGIAAHAFILDCRLARIAELAAHLGNPENRRDEGNTRL
jgi:hypothetical protein